jgi:diguanylate cyclase (GGDEF)-like protein
MSAALSARAEAGEVPRSARRPAPSGTPGARTWPLPRFGTGLLRRVLHLLEPPIGDLEPAYRRHFLKADVDQAVVGLWFLVIPGMFFAISDFMLVGFGPIFAALAVVRTFMGISTLVTIRYVRTVTEPASLDRALLIWSLLGVSTVFIMNSLRPPSHTLQLGIQALLLLAIYLVIPNNLQARLGMAIFVILMTAVLNLFGRRSADPLMALQVWSTVLLANVMGVAISARFFTLRRQQFLGRVELERIRDDLHTIATTDSLTGLLSRRRLLELGEQDLARARRYSRALSVLALDLDHFKQINDRYGHAAGDTVLVAVADALRAQTRQHDLLGRIGGEELAIVLPETSLDAAERLAERIRLRIAELRPLADGVPMHVTVSLGVAQACADDASIQDVLKRADRALYRAKAQGRDRVVAA